MTEGTEKREKSIACLSDLKQARGIGGIRLRRGLRPESRHFVELLSHALGP